MREPAPPHLDLYSCFFRQSALYRRWKIVYWFSVAIAASAAPTSALTLIWTRRGGNRSKENAPWRAPHAASTFWFAARRWLADGEFGSPAERDPGEGKPRMRDVKVICLTAGGIGIDLRAWFASSAPASAHSVRRYNP
jgi:hypothetical protein